MTDQARPQKICVICGQDCAGQPRTKDAKGRYYHTGCYEQARRSLEEKRAAAGAPPPPRPEEEVVDLLDEAADTPAAPAPAAAHASGAARACPNCGHALDADALICIECGYNLQTGKQLKSRKRKRRSEPAADTGSLTEFLVSPVGIGLDALVFLAIFFGLAMANEPVALAYIGLAWLFFFGVSITALVFAFIEGLGQGLLTLCVPFYILYFVYGVCENQYVRVLYGIGLIAYIAGLVLLYSMGGATGAGF
jgi:predicted nucleic acid-binding Zn ribbon protein